MFGVNQRFGQYSSCHFQGENGMEVAVFKVKMTWKLPFSRLKWHGSWTKRWLTPNIRRGSHPKAEAIHYIILY
jgi:hypothetical protein